MKLRLPAEVLSRQFDARVVRGAIIRFAFEAWDDPRRSQEGPKFAIVLNNPGVISPIYFYLTTSKAETYDKPGRRDAVVFIEPGEYHCFSKRTAIPLRAEPHQALRADLEDKLRNQKLTFEGDLKPVHLAQIDRIIRQGLYIPPHLRPHIDGTSSESPAVDSTPGIVEPTSPTRPIAT